MACIAGWIREPQEKGQDPQAKETSVSCLLRQADQSACHRGF